MGGLPHKLSAAAAVALAAAASASAASAPAAAGARDAPARTSAHHCRHTGLIPNHSNRRAVRRATRCLINVARRAHNRRALHRDRRLVRAAGGHSSAMKRRRFFAHGDVVARLRRSGYIRPRRSWAVGENIAWGERGLSSPRAIVRGWMHSRGHRENILSRRFREIGVGIAIGTPEGTRGATYTTDFGRARSGGHRARRGARSGGSGGRSGAHGHGPGATRISID